MRCVVYDPLDLEALTVINVPQHFIRELEQENRFPILHFPVKEPIRFVPYGEPIGLSPMKVATVRMERFYYGGLSTWCAMAMNPEICLLMRSELLPGQRHEA